MPLWLCRTGHSRDCDHVRRMQPFLVADLYQVLLMFLLRLTHPSRSLFTLLLSGKRYRSVCCCTAGLRSTVFPQSPFQDSSIQPPHSSFVVLWLIIYSFIYIMYCVSNIKGLPLTLCCRMTNNLLLVSFCDEEARITVMTCDMSFTLMLANGLGLDPNWWHSSLIFS